MISRDDRVGQRDVGADVEPEPQVGPLAPTPSAADRPTNSLAPLWTALSTWWKKIGCVSRALEPQSTITIGLLNLFIGRRSAARTEYRRQTDDARSVSGSVTGVDVVGAHHLARELLRQEIHLVRRLRAREDPERARSHRPSWRALQTRRGAVERLVPGGRAKLAVAPDSGVVSRVRDGIRSSLEPISTFRARPKLDRHGCIVESTPRPGCGKARDGKGFAPPRPSGGQLGGVPAQARRGRRGRRGRAGPDSPAQWTN